MKALKMMMEPSTGINSDARNMLIGREIHGNSMSKSPRCSLKQPDPTIAALPASVVVFRYHIQPDAPRPEELPS